MARSSNSNNRCPFRSISLPCRSHPGMARIEEELNKLKTWETSSTPTAEKICIGLSGLEELHKSIDELLNLPLTQQALSGHQHKRWINESLDLSLGLLDICSITRDVMLQIQEHVKDLQSAIRRRRKGDLSIESSITKYACFRKKTRKEVKKLIAEVKQMDDKIGASPLLELDSYHVSSVIRVLREVGSVSISIYHELLLYLSSPISKPKSSRWLLVSKFLDKGRVASEDQEEESVNELESVDLALDSLCRNGSIEGDKVQIAQNRLEDLERRVESIENGLELLFRHLIKARASLLNIISQ